MPAGRTSTSSGKSHRDDQDWIGDYRVVGEVGAGGMATVWKVRSRTGKVLALKEMKPQDEAHREMSRRFRQEFEVTARLSHRHIVEVHDFFETQDTLHIVMEFVDGLDLRDSIRHGGLLDAGRLAALGADIATGLSCAHDQDILHRDLKPENVLLSKRGWVKITDFGVARVLGTRLTATGIILGSPAYMSPEQLAGVSGQKLGATSDIYALGVLLYELVEGRDPLGLRKHEDLLTVLRAKREKRPRAFRRLDNPALTEFILACLEPEPEDRPHSADGAARTLRRIARSCGVKRADLQWLASYALDQRTDKARAKGEPAPFPTPASPERASRPAPEAPVAARAADVHPAIDGPSSRSPRSPSSSRSPSFALPPRRAPGERPQTGARALRGGVPSSSSSSPSSSLAAAEALPPRRAAAPARPAPSLPPLRARPAHEERYEEHVDERAHSSLEEDIGAGSRRVSRVAELSVKDRAARTDKVGVVSWLALILFALAVIFLGASTSLTGSPLGLLETLVPLP